MLVFDNLKKALNRTPSDVVGIDCSTSTARIVRIKKNGTSLRITSVAVLPLPEGLFSGAPGLEPLALTARLRGRFASMSIPSTAGSAKLLRVSESFDPGNRDDILSLMAIEKNDELRVATAVILAAAPKVEGRVLAATMAESQAKVLLKLLPAAGTPAPRAIELSEVAVINAFANHPRVAAIEGALGLIHFDHDFSLIALFNNKLLSQLRIFPFGAASVSRKVMKALNVDQPTAEGVITDGAFDISHLIEDGAKEIRSQLVIGRDFMERSENCTMERLFVSGPVTLIKPFLDGMPVREPVDGWDPLEGFEGENENAVPDEFKAESWRFTAAIGSCLGVLLQP